MERRDDLEVTKMSHFVGIGLMLGFLLPHTSTVLLLVNPLLCLFYQCFRQNRIFYKYNWMVVIPILVTLLINVSQEGVYAKAIMGCIAILLYFFCFPIVGKVKVPVFYFYIILTFIVLTQLAYVLNVPFLVSFLDTYYPISDTYAAYYGHVQDAATSENLMSFRMGGLYRNPNQCSRSLTFLLAAFLVLNHEKSIRRLLPFIIISIYAVMLTGSRTGFIVASLVAIAFIFFNKKLSVIWRFGVVLAAIVGFVFLISVGSNSFRGLDVTNTGSSDLKAMTFVHYLSSETSVSKILFGYLDSDRFESTAGVMNYFDADYGYIIFQFGLVGFFAILLYFFSIFLRMDKTGWAFFVLMLWMITSTIITSYRALFVFMLLLSVVYNNNKRGVLLMR